MLLVGAVVSMSSEIAPKPWSIESPEELSLESKADLLATFTLGLLYFNTMLSKLI